MVEVETVVKALKAYKAVNIRAHGQYDCRGFIFKAGKVYTHDGQINPCSSGFHCCPHPSDVYNYYTFGDNTEVFEVAIPVGAKLMKEGDKWCASKIKLVKPVTDKSFNIGDKNTGHSNTGNRNTGDWNTGNWNTGDRNTGDWNTGHRNTGDWNTGHRNTGYRNTGYRNTGYSNTGDWNTGDWNTCNFSTGFFNTIEAPVSLFNGAVFMPRQEVINHPGYQALLSVPLKLTKWINNADLPDEEKTGKYTDGKQSATGWLEAHKEWWANMSASNRKKVQELPGFDAAIFKEVTGIDVGAPA